MFKHISGSDSDAGPRSFNLLSEILFVQAIDLQRFVGRHLEFQSLERDSVCSSENVHDGVVVKLRVSIS